jgi:hypothetical protein
MLLDRFHFLHITDRVCPKHHSPLTPHTRADIGDGWELRCDPCGYRNHVSIRADSYFSRAHLSVPTILCLLRDMYWCHSDEAIRWAARVDQSTLHDYYIDMTNRMHDWLYANPFKGVPLFNGDEVVEINELYKHHTIPFAIGQYLGGELSEGVWVFGAVNRDKTVLYYECIESRKATDLIPLIHLLVEPGATIISDALSTYKQLKKDYTYYVINKEKDGFSRETTDENGHPFTVTVNHIENRWRWLRQLYRETHKIHAQYTQRILDEAMYRFYQHPWLDLVKRTAIQ